MTQDAFLASRLVQDAVIRNFEIIGEAAGNLQRVAPQLTANHPEIPWHLPRGMRNFLAHAYWSVDPSTIWNTVAVDLAGFKLQVDALREELAATTRYDPT
jgi:uncharacterized protein with HEPN domain